MASRKAKSVRLIVTVPAWCATPSEARTAFVVSVLSAIQRSRMVARLDAAMAEEFIRALVAPSPQDIEALHARALSKGIDPDDLQTVLACIAQVETRHV